MTGHALLYAKYTVMPRELLAPGVYSRPSFVLTSEPGEPPPLLNGTGVYLEEASIQEYMVCMYIYICIYIYNHCTGISGNFHIMNFFVGTTPLFR